MIINQLYLWAAWAWLLFCRTEANVKEIRNTTSKVIRTSDWISFWLSWMQHVSAMAPPASLRSTKHTINIAGDNFMLDGQNLHIISGSLHYFRVPSEYWRDRLQKLKAAGLNTVSTYVEWSYHEPEERQYKFSGDRDVARFVQLAAEEGLHVLLRPGPYICAERDLGGLPYWLLGKYPKIQLRSKDRDFMNESRIWLEKLFGYLKPLLFGNGGPIILVQVENEYGSYASDMTYKEQLRDIMLEHVGTNALLYTTDGSFSKYFKAGAVPGTLTTVDFGPSDQPIPEIFAELRRYMSSGPLMNSEYYPGWLSLWGKPFATVSTPVVIDTLRKMMQNKININFYVFFGGTNFEYMAGAASNPYDPDLTSYDYDAPLTEAGDPTTKYFAIREVLKEYNSELASIPEPQPSPKGKYGIVALNQKFQLFSPKGRNTLGKNYQDITGSMLPTFEALRQRAGVVLYETRVNSSGILHISKPRDWIYVYINGELQGIINRMYNIFNLPVKTQTNAKLALLVENQGRINYGPAKDLHDFKGILGKIKMDGNIIKDRWSVTGFPLENIEPFQDTDNNLEHTETNDGPVVLDGYLELPPGEQPLDTYLDMTGWGKGYVWINGHHLGRYWLMPGPQVTLYVPGVWLKAAPAKNYIQIVEFEKRNPTMAIEFIDYPILNRTQAPKWRFD